MCRAIAVLLLFASMSGAQERERISEPELVRRVVGGGDEATAASHELMARGRLALHELVLALEHTEDAAVRARLTALEQFCRVGGATVGGLRVGLRAPERPIAPGDEVRLTITLCNASDIALDVHVGLDVSGNGLINGSALRAVTGNDPVEREHMRSELGFCGTGAKPLFERIAPWSSRVFELTGRLESRSAGDGQPAVPVLRIGPPRGCYLPIGDRDTLRLRAGLTVAREMRQWLHREQDESLWVGEIESDDAILKLKR